MVGQTLGHYRILEKLGEGGMGVVYRAEDTTLKRQVALKVLPAELSSSRERLERFQREAEALAALDGDQRCVDVMRGQLLERKTLCCARLDKLSSCFSYVPPKGAFYVFPSCAGLIGKQNFGN